MNFKLLSAACLLAGSLTAAVDHYPEARALILEAAESAKKSTVPPVKNRPLHWGAELLARAGYLEDAFKVAALAGSGPEQFVRARTLYGDFEGVRKHLAALRDPDENVVLSTSIATILWRMGDKKNAKLVLDLAVRTTAAIPNPTRRAARLGPVKQLLEALPNDPPIPLSTEPRPVPKPFGPTPIPAFPITVDGFAPRNPDSTNTIARKNEAYLTELYGLVAAGNREGLLKHTESASSPFQMTLALASLEHLLIQLGMPAEAESYARQIPATPAECRLARAEALSAAGLAWAKKGDSERAHQCFEEALADANAIDKGLTYGKAIVVGSIAANQAEAGMMASSASTFKLALRLASVVPARPGPVKGVYAKNYFKLDLFQDDALRALLKHAMRARDLGAARQVAEAWRKLGGEASTSIIDAWLAADRKDEALAFARSLGDPGERAEALLWIASQLLNNAGAPIL